MGIQERRARERQARRTAVLDATRGLLRERGFVGTTTKEIARRCELSEATLFWYFQSKDEILVSLLFEAIDYMARGLEEIRTNGGPGEKKLAQLWRFFSQVRQEHPEYYHVFTYLAHPRSMASVTEEVRAELARLSGDNFRRLAVLLHESVGGENVRLLADLLWSAFVGLMVLRDSRANLGATPHPSDGELASVFEPLLAAITGGNNRGGKG